MVHKILIFNFFLFIGIFNNSFLNAKTIIGNPNIIDGDTIYINSSKIRLHGIDAPEREQNCIFEQKKWLCGMQSTIQLKKLINSQIIKCIVNDVDIYKRYVAICYLNKLNINKTMVKNGWAIAYRYYSKDYIDEEFIAKRKKLGIWKGTFEEPYIFRKKNK